MRVHAVRVIKEIRQAGAAAGLRGETTQLTDNRRIAFRDHEERIVNDRLTLGNDMVPRGKRTGLQ